MSDDQGDSGKVRSGASPRKLDGPQPPAAANQQIVLPHSIGNVWRVGSFFLVLDEHLFKS